MNTSRWLAMVIVCTAELMTVVDSAIVNIALPAIRQNLGFSERSLIWVVNGYLLSYGGLLLLGGRLGDLFGPRRLFLLGVGLFTIASLGCGLAQTQEWLITARLIQGAGGAIVSATALSLIARLFQRPDDRAKAMAVYGFVCASGGIIGIFAGGALVSALSWHWIFLINIPFGIAALCYGVASLPRDRKIDRRGRVDIAGAATITGALVLSVYSVVNDRHDALQTGGFLAGAGVLLILFIAVEATTETPLVPLGLFQLRTLTTANVVGAFWIAATFATYYAATLYLQRVLHYDAMHVSLDFLPGSLTMAALSLGLSSKIVSRYGIRWPAAVGLLICASGSVLLAAPQIAGGIATAVFVAMVLFGVGSGVAFNPLLLAALSEVDAKDSGLASGIFHTSQSLGGALGLGVLTSLSVTRTEELSHSGIDAEQALTSGYQLTFVLGAVCIAIAWLLVMVMFPERPPTSDAVMPENFNSQSFCNADKQ